MATTDMFLKLDGIDGESADAKHKNELDILSWSWGLTQSGSMHRTTGGGIGKVSVGDISISRLVDKASPELLKRVCTGNPVSSATLFVRKAGGNALEYYKIELTDVLISSYNLGAHHAGTTEVEEHITLNFAKFHTTYTPQNKDGSKGGAVEVTYDIAAAEGS